MDWKYLGSKSNTIFFPLYDHVHDGTCASGYIFLFARDDFKFRNRRKTGEYISNKHLFSGKEEKFCPKCIFRQIKLLPIKLQM